MQFVGSSSWFMIALCAPPLVFTTTKITKESANMPTHSRLIRPESALAPACREGNHPSPKEGAGCQNEGVCLVSEAKFCKEPITASGEACT